MNLIKARLIKMAGDKPFNVKYKEHRLENEHAREEALIKYDVLFNVNAKLIGGVVADFSLPEMKDTAVKLRDVMCAQINEMNGVSFQDNIVDTVTGVIVQNISDNYLKMLEGYDGKKTTSIFKRTTAKVSGVRDDSIFNNQFKIHFEIELATGNITKEIAENIKKAYETSKNHCSRQICKRLSDLYKWEKTNNRGLEEVESVAIKYQSFLNYDFKETIEKEETKEMTEEEKFEEVDRLIRNYSIMTNAPCPKTVKREICLEHGVDPSWFDAELKSASKKRLIKKAFLGELKEDMKVLLKNCVEKLNEKVKSFISEMRPEHNSAEEINSEAYNLAYEKLYEEPTINNIAKSVKTTIDDVVMYALSNFGESLITGLENAYIKNLGGMYQFAKKERV